MHSSPAPTDWSFDPAVLLALAALLGGYLFIIGPLRERVAPDEPTQRRRIVAFAAGWLTLALALVSPLDALGRAYLFSAHTLQLFLLITVVAPLFLIGLPEWLWWTLLPTRALRDATRGVLFPTVAVIAFNGIILIWHVAPFYEAALHSPSLHDLQNASFLLAGLLTWWPLLTPLDRHTRLASPFQILYLVVESLPLDVFGAFTLFAQRVFYPTYALAPRLFGLSPLADQAIGGAILAVPGNLLDIVLMSLAFFGWIAREEQAQAARERLLYDTPQDALVLPAEVEPPAG
jgi:putative membrane protein